MPHTLNDKVTQATCKETPYRSPELYFCMIVIGWIYAKLICMDTSYIVSVPFSS